MGVVLAKPADNGTWYVECDVHGLIESGIPDWRIAADMVVSHSIGAHYE